MSTDCGFRYYTLKKIIQLPIICILCLLIPLFTIVQYTKGAEQKGALYSKIVISGIVDENNTALGYIAIYNPDNQENIIEIYNYLDPQKVSVTRNYKKTELNAVEEGDTAFLELDKDGYVVSISAVSNYIVKYGMISHKSPLSITVEYDNKEQEVFRTDSLMNVLFKGKRSKRIISSRSMY